MSNSKYKLKGLSLNLKKLPLPLLVDMTAVSVSPELHRAQVTILVSCRSLIRRLLTNRIF
jgi:hypothetical protein